jgi:hypothetical protein
MCFLSKKAKKMLFFFTKEGIFNKQGSSVVDANKKMNKASSAIVKKRDLC